MKDLLDRDSYSFNDEMLDQEVLDRIVDTLGDSQLSNRVLHLYYRDSIAMFVNQFSNYGGYLDYVLQSLGLNLNKPLDEQIYDESTGMTWEQFFLKGALEDWRQTVILGVKGKEAGFEMPQEYEEQFKGLKANLEYYAQMYSLPSVDAYLQEIYGPGCTFDLFYQYNWDLYYSQLYLQEYATGLPVTDADKDAYYQANKEQLDSMYGTRGVSVDARHILVMPQDNNWDIALTKAEALLQQYLDGEQTEAAFAALATANTEDGGSKDTGGLYEDMYLGQMVKPFEDWCFDEARQYADVGIVQTDYGYHIMFFVRTEPGLDIACTQGVQSEKAQADLNGWLEESPVHVQYGAIALHASTPA